MSKEIAQGLFETGRGHAMAAQLLYLAALDKGEEEGKADPDQFAFNGVYSLSIHHLVGLGFELMLKAAYVALGGDPDDGHLQRAIGHDLRAALDLAGEQGFHSTAHHLPEIVDILRDPYKAHYFRYHRPETFPLPDFANLEQALVTLAGEVEVVCAH